jgi:hypothetical protein
MSSADPGRFHQVMCKPGLAVWAMALLAPAAALGCRGKVAPPPAAPAATPAGVPGVEPAPEITLNDADAYFAVIEPHMQRVSIYDPPEKFLAEYGKTPEKTRNLLAAHWCVAEISNGGFVQLFSSAAGVLVPEAVVGLRALGLEVNAAVLQEAMKALGDPYPREHKRRYRLVDAAKRKGRTDNPFAGLDDRFFAELKRRPGGFDAVAAAYARGPE